MATKILGRSFALLAAGAIIASFLTVAFSSRSAADVPDPPVAAEFQAAQCAGSTEFNPTVNSGSIIPDATLVFGERLTSYNAGRIVPLYDAYGGTALIEPDGSVNTSNAGYPPICGVRYESVAGGPVSEWMFCTDRESQACGDTNEFGQIVDHDGNPLNPMDALPANPRLAPTPDKERLIAYLIQHGHSYSGVGDQSWGGVTEARSDLSTNERLALQTLVWCISDPDLGGSTDFAATCEATLPASEQTRLMTLIPNDPELTLTMSPAATQLHLGETARFYITTNIFNQPITLALGGTASATWEVCEGDATINGPLLTITGTDPSSPSTVTICATSSTVGSALISAEATPASLTHIGWSQSRGNSSVPPCQVFATFHTVQRLVLTGNASAEFITGVTPGAPNEKPKTNDLAATGGQHLSTMVGIGAGALILGVLLFTSRRRFGRVR